MASFPGPIVKPANILDGQDILAAHVGPLWDETIAIAAQVLTNQTDVATNVADIATNAGDIATNVADIATNAADILAVQGDVATNAADIVSLQADKQDVSEKGVAGGYASLDGAGRIPASQLSVSAMEYQGSWDATTNTPVLVDGVGDAGDMYRVSVAGTQDLGSGPIEFGIGDLVLYDGLVWEKADTTDAVSSVAGKTGAVVLDHDDITDFDAEIAAAVGDYLPLAGGTLTGTVQFGVSNRLNIDTNGNISFNNVNATLQATAAGSGGRLSLHEHPDIPGYYGLGGAQQWVHQASHSQTFGNTGYILFTDGGAATTMLRGKLTGRTNDNFGIRPSGALRWLFNDDGVETASISEVAAGVLELDGALQVTGDVGFHGVAAVGQSAHIADPAGGATVDAEARSAINDILVVLENHGLTAVA